MEEKRRERERMLARHGKVLVLCVVLTCRHHAARLAGFVVYVCSHCQKREPAPKQSDPVRRRKPGTLALKEIRFQQKQVDFGIPCRCGVFDYSYVADHSTALCARS